MDGGRGSDGADREPRRRPGRDGIGSAAGAALTVPEGHPGRTRGCGGRPGRRQRSRLAGRRASKEQYERRLVTPWVKDLYSISYERTYRGLPVVGGDAVVLADGSGQGPRPPVRLLRRIDVATAAVGHREGRRVRRAGAAAPRSTRSRAAGSWCRLKDDKPVLAWETVLSGRTRTAPSRLHVFTDARTGSFVDSYDDVVAGSGTGKWNGPGPITIDTTDSGSHLHAARPEPDRPELRGLQHRHGLHEVRRLLGHRQPHEQGDRLRGPDVRRAEAVGHARPVAGPQRLQRQRPRLPGQGRPERPQRLLGRQLGHHRAQPGQRVDRRHRRGGPRVRPRHRLQHPRRHQRPGGRPRRGHR